MVYEFLIFTFAALTPTPLPQGEGLPPVSLDLGGGFSPSVRR